MLKFYSVLPSHTRNFPIERASIKHWQWYQRMLDDLNAYQNRPIFHTARCPGILEICNHGWIQRTYQDIALDTIGDGSSFSWYSEIEQHSIETWGDLLGPYISHHPPSDFMDFGSFRPQSLRSIVKINSPWFVQIPPQHSLLVMPVPYADDCVFSAAPGVLRGTSSLNVQLFWHRLNGKTIVPKGTALCHYMLVPDHDESHSIVDVDVTNWNEIQTELAEDISRRYRNQITVPKINTVHQHNSAEDL